jgi:hypothetical protein
MRSFGVLYAFNCTFIGSEGSSSFPMSYTSFFAYNCLFSQLGYLKPFGSNVVITDSEFRDTYVPSTGLVSFDGGCCGTLNLTRVVFLNVSSGTGALFFDNHFDSGIYFEDCNFQLSSPTTQFLRTTYNNIYYSTILIRRCNFTWVGDISSVPLISFTSSNPHQHLLLVDCVIQNFLSQSTSPLISISTDWDVLIQRCQFYNISASYGILSFISVSIVTIDYCIFKSIISGSALIQGNVNNGSVIFNDIIMNDVTSRFSGVMVLSSAIAAPIIIKDMNFSVVHLTARPRGAILITSGSALFYNCSFADFSGAPIMFISQNASANLTSIAWKHGNDAVGGFLQTEMNSSISIQNSWFDGNQVEVQMSTMNIATQCSVILQDSHFTRIYSKGNGGAISLSTNSIIAISGSTFENITALNGGAIFSNLDSFVTIRATNFSGNQASGKGGAIMFMGSNWTLSLVIFSSNSALFGGGLYTAQLPENQCWNVSFQNNTAFNNSQLSCSVVKGVGGAIFVQNLTTSKISNLCNFSFVNNYAASFGGVLAYSNLMNDNESILSHFLSLPVFDSNFGFSHGPLIGSGWVRFNVTFEDVEDLHVGSSFRLFFNFYDVFNQLVTSHAPCQIEAKITSSTPPDYFELFPEKPTVIQAKNFN